MDKFYEERVRRLRERVLSKDKKEVFDQSVELGKLSKDEIKEMLDKEGVEYKASDSKERLLKLLEK